MPLFTATAKMSPPPTRLLGVRLALALVFSSTQITTAQGLVGVRVALAFVYCSTQIMSAEGQVGCSIMQLDDVESITTVCCENTDSGDCSQGFPDFCPHACAAVLSSFWSDCGPFLISLGDVYPEFDEKLLKDFAEGTCQVSKTPSWPISRSNLTPFSLAAQHHPV